MKQRSAAYPYFEIEYCLSFVDSIYTSFGRYRASREDIAEATNQSVGSITQKMSSSVQYGLLDLKSKEGYKVTDCFLKWKRPIEEDRDKIEAIQEAFRHPPLYAALLNEFGNDILPPIRPLSNILFQKHSISDSASERAAKTFESNAIFAKYLTDDRRLIPMEFEDRVDGNNADVIEGVLDDEPQQPVVKDTPTTNHLETLIPNKQPETKTIQSSSDGVVINILLKERRTAHLGLPPDAKSSDLDTIINWIRLMKESFVE